MTLRPLGLLLVLLSLFVPSRAQISGRKTVVNPVLFSSDAAPDPLGGAGGGQAEPSALRPEAFTRATFDATLSPLGFGPEIGTNFSPRVDARIFGNYLNLGYTSAHSGFNVDVHIRMANAGAKVDIFPLQRFPLRISPGFLYFNQNRVRADLRAAEPGATFTLNNVDYASAPYDPVHGTGQLRLGGTGFMVTAGMGHIVSHSRRRFTFPWELGVAFIDTPSVTFQLFGTVCHDDLTGCQPAAQFPTFATNLAAQVRSWNNRVAPFHVYPIVQGGVAYSFGLHRRDVY